MARKKEKFIRKIDVLGHTLSIEWQAKLEKDEEGREVVGEYLDYERKIRLSKMPDSGKKMDTDLLHESLHAVLRLSGYATKMSEEDEEQLVILLENALSTILEFKSELYT